MRSTSGKYILRLSAAPEPQCPAPHRPPQTSEELRAAILDRYEDLSKRLQQIARYVLDEPNAVALETLAVIGERAGVQPSAIVRFAKAIGFESASQMQKVIRDGLIAGSAVLGYSERVRQFSEDAARATVDAPPTCWPSSSKATCWR